VKLSAPVVARRRRPRNKSIASADLPLARAVLIVSAHCSVTQFEEAAMRRTITRILVPTDFSPASEMALDSAIAIAQRFGASLHLLHVVNDPLVEGAGWGSEVYVASVPTLRETLINEAAPKLAVLLARAEQHRIPARSEVRIGRAAETIRDVAQQQASDLIVMGTHGRTGVAHLVMGSVAEKTVRRAPCPVMTVRAGDPFAAERAMFESELVPTE
jgi:universal stress protein A